MKRNLLLLFFVLLFVNALFSQNPLVKQWDKRFGGIKGDELYTFQQTFDRGYILGGTSHSNISGDKTQDDWDTTGYTNDYWIVKTDSQGIKQWDKRFGGFRSDELRSLQQTSDGGYILGGYSYSDSSGDRTQRNWDTICQVVCSDDYWIVKTDSLGSKQWDKRFGGNGHDDFRSLLQTTDGGYILGGSSLSDSSGDKTQPPWGQSDYWIVKTDSIGNKQWDKRFGGVNYDYFISLCQSNDGGYVIGGSSYSGISGDKTQALKGFYDYWILKIDSIGNKEWDKDLGGTDGDYLTSIKPTNDGGFILHGWSYSGIGGDKTQPNWDTTENTPDFWIVKIDSSGNQQWDKRFGGTDEEGDVGNISQTPDAGYLIGGYSQSPLSGDKTESNLGYGQSWIIKTDSVGIKQWDKTIFTLGFDQLGFAIQTNDGCYAIANCTFSNIGGYKTQSCQGMDDFWIIKFCDSTLSTSINQISNSQLPFSIYPNPTNAKLNLYLKSETKIIVTNLVGVIVLQKSVMGKIELDVSFLSAGIYFVKAGNEVWKFVKE